MSCTALITQEDLECTLGRGDVPGDILGSLVPGLLPVEYFSRRDLLYTVVRVTNRDIHNNGVLNRVDA